MTDAENPPTEERQNEILAALTELEAQIDEQNATIESAVARSNRCPWNRWIQRWRTGFSRFGIRWVDIETTSENEVEVFFYNNGTRLAQVGWAGDLRGYFITTTLIHGRPGMRQRLAQQ